MSVSAMLDRFFDALDDDYDVSYSESIPEAL